MENDLDLLTLGETPEEFIENDDGSVTIPGLEAVDEPDDDFQANLAEILPQKELTRMAQELCDSVEKDKEARKKRDQQYEEGLRRTGLGDDAPGGAEFSGSSRVVHPLLAEGCVDFASRAIKELFPSTGPVRSFVAGEATPQKLERATRKARFMNWQLTTQIEEYRDELEQLLTQLPMGGSQYQKFWWDEVLERPRCEFVPIDEVYLPFAVTNFYTASRVTHRQPITRHEFRRRVDSGLYRDVFVPEAHGSVDLSLSTQANDKIEGREDDGYNEDGLRAILEIYTWRTFEDDPITGGRSAPYIISIDEDSEKVLAVYRNWAPDDPKLKKLDWMVEWKFIPWRGAYAIGLPHLIGGLAASMTGALRALLDSAHINNTASMLKLKSGRVVGQNTQVNVTQVTDIEGPAGIDDIRKLAMPMPFNPPSAVLSDLMDKLQVLAKGVIATTEDQMSQVGDRTPVGTTMALIEQGSTTYSAIHSRLHHSQKKALEILQRIDMVYLDVDAIEDAVGEFTITPEDFAQTMDVLPVSDPTIFSESQRYAQSQSLVQMSQDQTVPWNKINIYRRVLKQMRIEAIDELLPAEKPPFTGTLGDENRMISQGFPLKAAQEQNHQVHIQGHLAYIASPLIMSNPMVPPPMIQSMLGHLQEHIQMWLDLSIQQMAQASGIPDPEQAYFLATQQVMTQAQQFLGPIYQQIQAIQQQLQQRTPPPQMPPEVQASIQIAQADIQRKAEYDKGMLQIKQAETQANQQLDQLRLQMDQQQIQLKNQLDRMAQQVELLKNREDNQQKQITELVKNRDDNLTKVQIAGKQSEDQAALALQQQLNDQAQELNLSAVQSVLGEGQEGTS